MEHHKAKGRSNNNDCANCIVFDRNLLPDAKLPTLHSIFCYYFYLRTSLDYNQKSVDDGVTLDVMNQWVSCNVYPQIHKCVQKQLKELNAKFNFLKDYPKVKKKDAYWKEHNLFVTNYSKFFYNYSARIKFIEQKCALFRFDTMTLGLY